MKKILSTCFALAICALMGSQLPADTIDLTVNSTTSSIGISLGGGAVQTSPAAGTMAIDLASNSQPFGSAQLTNFDFVLQNGLNFTLLGLVQISTRPNDTRVLLLTPGAAGAVVNDQFNQTGNSVGLSGTADVVDPLNIVGGSGEFSLGDVEPTDIDFNNVTVTRVGRTVSVNFQFSVTYNLVQNNIEIPIVINGTINASGVVPLELGDANGDGVVNNDDINAFILALLQPQVYADTYPDIDPNVVLDFSGDNVFDNNDINGFLTALGL